MKAALVAVGERHVRAGLSCRRLPAERQDEHALGVETALDAERRCFQRIRDVAAAKIVFVDFHAEATSEKIAMGWHLDGKVTLVVGTHTHVQTADERVLKKGTAFLTDAGMCGPFDSIIGMNTEAAKGDITLTAENTSTITAVIAAASARARGRT